MTLNQFGSAYTRLAAAKKLHKKRVTAKWRAENVEYIRADNNANAAKYYRAKKGLPTDIDLRAK